MCGKSAISQCCDFDVNLKSEKSQCCDFSDITEFMNLVILWIWCFRTITQYRCITRFSDIVVSSPPPVHMGFRPNPVVWSPRVHTRPRVGNHNVVISVVAPNCVISQYWWNRDIAISWCCDFSEVVILVCAHTFSECVIVCFALFTRSARGERAVSVVLGGFWPGVGILTGYRVPHTVKTKNPTES